jgi:hypothetical protein
MMIAKAALLAIKSFNTIEWKEVTKWEIQIEKERMSDDKQMNDIILLAIII